jgi:hypothetical protein
MKIKKIKEKIIFRSLVYLLCLLMMLNCGAKSDNGDPSTPSDPQTPETITPPVVGGDPGSGELADLLAKEDDQYKEQDPSVTDDNGNPVWSDTGSPEATCVEGNPNSSIKKTLHVDLNFCMYRQDALIISDDTMYFQHFSDGSRIQRNVDSNLDPLEQFINYLGNVFDNVPPYLRYTLLLGWEYVRFFYLYFAEFIQWLLGVIGLDDYPDAPDYFMLREPYDVGNAPTCFKDDLASIAKITTNDISDVWENPATLPYQLNINKDSNCSTSIKNYAVTYKSEPITVEQFFSSNGANYRTWVIKFDNKKTQPIPQAVTISFDFEYYELSSQNFKQKAQTDSCSDVFSCEQENQNTKEMTGLIIKEEGKDQSSVDYSVFPEPACTKDKQGTSTLKTSQVSLEFYALNSHALDIIYNTMLFKHVSFLTPYTVNGQNGVDKWKFSLREPSSITMSKWVEENESNYYGLIHVYSSTYHASISEFDIWKYPNFVPYNLGIKQNYDCTTKIKNVNVTGDVAVILTSSVNQMNTLMWEFLIRKQPQTGSDNPKAELTKLSFDYEYYGY